MKVGVQWNRPLALRKPKVRSIGCAVDSNFFKCALIISSRGQNAAKPFDRAQVRVRKRIVSAQRSHTRSVRLPRAKISSAEDLPFGFGIGQRGLKPQWRIRTSTRHLQTRNLELNRQFAWSERINNQLRVFKNELVDNDPYRCALRPHSLHLCALFPRRQIQAQSVRIYRVHVHGRAQEVCDFQAETEVCNRYDRLHTWLVIVGIRIAEYSEAFARNLQTLNQRNMKCVQFNLALEPGR